MTGDGAKTTQDYWDRARTGKIRLRLPSGLLVDVKNLQRLLKKFIKPGMQVLELGFAPGKILAWVAKVLQAEVAGLDYSPVGFQSARRLFAALEIQGDLRQEDVFATSFSTGRFDVVYSVGLVEHFDDPREIIRQHVLLARPGGWVLIMVPNLGGIYGRLGHYFNPTVLAVHNLSIMSPEALTRLAPQDLISHVAAYQAGRLSPGLISFHKKYPPLVAKLFWGIINLAGLVQPGDLGCLCPLLVLELKRKER